MLNLYKTLFGQCSQLVVILFSEYYRKTATKIGILFQQH